MLTISLPRVLKGEGGVNLTNLVDILNIILWFQRLGAEATAEAIADMYENHNAVQFRCAYLKLAGNIVSATCTFDFTNLFQLL